MDDGSSFSSSTKKTDEKDKGQEGKSALDGGGDDLSKEKMQFQTLLWMNGLFQFLTTTKQEETSNPEQQVDTQEQRKGDEIIATTTNGIDELFNATLCENKGDGESHGQLLYWYRKYKALVLGSRVASHFSSLQISAHLERQFVFNLLWTFRTIFG